MTLAQINIGDTFFNVNHAAARQVFTTPGSLINQLLPNLLILAGLIFFVLILGGGFGMIRSAGGQGSPQDAAKAKNAVTFALIGFLLVVTAYFILQIVGAMLGIDFINPPAIP